MSNDPKPTGRTFQVCGFHIEEVSIEPCYRAEQIAQGKRPACFCSSCKRRHAKRMAEEMGAAAVEIFRCVYLGECEGRAYGECSWQPHHVISFARSAWHYALEAEGMVPRG